MDNVMDLKDIILQGLDKLSIDSSIINEILIDRIMFYKNILNEWNGKINLTAIEGDKEVIIKHFLDSFSIIPFINNEGNKIIDIGTGAGFPGIPLKLINDVYDITLVDSLEKRIKFLNEVINQLKLKGITTIHGRAEDLAHKDEYREKYDISVARAVAGLPILLEYCLPFVKVGGIFVAMKGSSKEEIDISNKALDILGGKIEEIREFNLPFSDIKRTIIIVRKYRQTSTKYPRKAGTPSKNPLI